MHGVLDDDDSIHGHAPSVSSVMLYVVFWLTGTCTELLPLTSHAYAWFVGMKLPSGLRTMTAVVVVCVFYWGRDGRPRPSG